MERTATTTASAASVWAAWARPTSWPSWTETVTSVEELEPGTDPAVGVSYRLRQPKLPRAVWTITALEPDREFTWESRGPGVRSVASHRVTERADGGADLFASLDWHGPLAPVLRLLLGRLSERYVETELAGLVAHCEGR